MFDLVVPEPLEPVDQRQLFDALAKVGKRLDAKGRANFLTSFARTRGELHGFERLDSNEAGLFGVQLEYLVGRQREIKYADFKWRLFVPVGSDAPAGAESWTATFWDAAGMAGIVANYGDDIRKVGAFAKRYTYPIRTFALGYDWSVIDIDRAALAGVNYRNRKSDAVKKGFEARWEQIAATGVKSMNMFGLVNNANVPVIAAASVGGSALWGSAGKSANDVLNDLLAAEDSVFTATSDAEKPDTALFSLAKFRYLQKTPIYTGAGSQPRDTILGVYLERSRSVRNVDYWLPLATADAAGTGPRAIFYKRDPEHVHLEMPKLPTELPPQAKNLVVEVNSYAYSGGVVFEYPLSAVYMDGM